MNYRAYIDASLTSVLESAEKEGPDAVLSLICALEEKARALREMRSGMIISPLMQCRDCGKHWTVPMTVHHERNWGAPDNCPTCYNESKGVEDASAFTHTFHYVEKP